MFQARRSGRHRTMEINFFWILNVVNILCSCLASGALLPNAKKNNSSSPSTNNGDDLKKLTDSYGNPIEYSKPIDTPDGRKVISAHGVQFELPGYASGITDIKKPTDDLLPPFVDPNEIVAQQLKWDNMAASTTTESSIEIENAQIIEITSTSTQEPDGTTEISTTTTTASEPPTEKSTLFAGIPAYLADYNDTNVGGGVPYSGLNGPNGLKVLTWDLIPPNDMHPPLYTSESSPAKSTVPIPQKNDAGKIIRISLTPGQSYGVKNPPLFTTPIATPNYMISTTEKIMTTTNALQNTKTTESESAQLTTDDEYLMLPGGNSNTVPPWLADYTDPYVSGAVTYVAPTTSHHNIDDIDHTLHNDVLPPLDTFTIIKIPDPSAQQETSTTPISSSTYSPVTGAIDPLNFKGQAQPKKEQTQQTQKQTTNSERSATHKQELETTPSAHSNNIHSIPTTTITTTNSAPTLHTTTQEPIKITQSPLVHEYHSTTVNVDEIVAATETVPSFGDNNFHNFLSTLSSSSINHNIPIDKSKDSTTTIQPYPVTDLLPPKEEDENEEELRNPFDSATIPPWLKDYKDPLVGPEVPFVYRPSNRPIQPIVTVLLPPFEGSENANIFPEPSTPFDSGYKSNPFLAKIRPSTFPQQSNTNLFLQPPQPSSHVVTEPSKILVPSGQVPSLNAGEVSQTLPNENNNDFPAPFDQKSINQRGSFPQNVFSKSDDGKVLSNRRPQTSQQGQNNFNSFTLPFVEPGSPFRPTTSSLAKGFKAAATPASSIADGKYTGGFGGAPGILGNQAKPGFAIQSDGTIRDPDHTYRPPQGGFTPSDVAYPKPIASNVAPVIASTNSEKGSKYTGRFGGPPGILVPFDNAGRRT